MIVVLLIRKKESWIIFCILKVYAPFPRLCGSSLPICTRPVSTERIRSLTSSLCLCMGFRSAPSGVKIVSSLTLIKKKYESVILKQFHGRQLAELLLFMVNSGNFLNILYLSVSSLFLFICPLPPASFLFFRPVKLRTKKRGNPKVENRRSLFFCFSVRSTCQFFTRFLTSILLPTPIRKKQLLTDYMSSQNNIGVLFSIWSNKT